MNQEIKRRDLGLSGVAIVLVQAFTSYHSSQTVSEQLERLETQLQDSRVHVEEFFVRKIEMHGLSEKIETVNDEVIKLRRDVSSLRSFLKDQLKYDGEEISCRDEWRVERI